MTLDASSTGRSSPPTSSSRWPSALYYSPRAGKRRRRVISSSGRNLPWWLAGTSMVATTFAADTPLAVAGFVARNGIAGNWIWWNAALGSMLTVFFFARLWRRAGIMTDVEFAELRYAGRPAARAARLSRALSRPADQLRHHRLGQSRDGEDPRRHDGMGSADRRARQPGDHRLLLARCPDSGAWSSPISFSSCSRWRARSRWRGSRCSVPPSAASTACREACPRRRSSSFRASASDRALAAGPALALPVAAFFAYIGVQWWASWYPGQEPGGGGYIAQRMMSARDERHSFFATLWFTIAHYCLRPWPWILVGLASLVLYPDLTDKEAGYVMVMRDYLPPGWRGMLLGAFFAAYMSTISTQLNWGTSYIVNDFYRRFVQPDGRRAALRVGLAHRDDHAR